MEKHAIKAHWLDNMAFETELNGHKFILDAGVESGGADRGPRPKALMLTALAGCTAMDIVSILKKMRVEIEDLNVHVEGELTEDFPKQYHKIHVIYEFKGKDLPLAKLQKAVSLSEDQYCGVGAVYKKVMPVTSEIVIVD